MSVNVDRDNGTIAIYGTPRHRWKTRGYTLATLNTMVRQPIDEVENWQSSPARALFIRTNLCSRRQDVVIGSPFSWEL
jgi:hypothetical protein